jgi:alginate O-acetyltransferase complex protein AlgI
MAFSSAPFLFFFLPLFFFAYFSIPSAREKNWVILIFSLIFYGWGEPWFVLVLALSMFLTWVAAMRIDR